MASNIYPKKNPYWPESSNLPPDINLRPGAFNEFIAHHGIRCTIEKTTICPNYLANVKGNLHDPNCTICENNFVHYNSITCYVLPQQNMLQKMFLERGEYTPGQMIVTIPSLDEDGNDIVAGVFDRITFIDQTEKFYELKNKSEGNVDLLRYHAVSIEFITTASRGKDNPFVLDEDFQLDENGNIEWLPGANRPMYDPVTGIGEAFTVSYLFKPVYRILQFMHEGRYSQKLTVSGRVMTRFPQTALIRKDYWIRKKDIDGMFMNESPLDQNSGDEPEAEKW